MKHVFDSAIAVIGTTLTYLFGGWDVAIQVLIAFMIMDYITGIMYAVNTQTLNSEIGFKGLLKKLSIILILIMAVLLDRLTHTNGWLWRTLVCYFYIANEGISILENCGNLGVPIPSKILQVLQKFKDNAEVKDDVGK